MAATAGQNGLCKCMWCVEPRKMVTCSKYRPPPQRWDSLKMCEFLSSPAYPSHNSPCPPVSLYSTPHPPFIRLSQPKLQSVNLVSSFSVHSFKNSSSPPAHAPLSAALWLFVWVLIYWFTESLSLCFSSAGNIFNTSDCNCSFGKNSNFWSFHGAFPVVIITSPFILLFII